ncbi:hypothetical protein HZC08_01630 [Candidatus Micrarchaeota archaeon]|nr:hypothetical protein [Candidatus Micrarchaeota archaeon]
MTNAKTCPACKNGSEGFDSMDNEFVKNLGNIETRMSCGCGGAVTHSILSCAPCKSYYLDTYEEHLPPHDEYISLHKMEKPDAESLVKKWKKCLNDKNCDCEIHKDSEKLNAGKQVYSESISQDA